MKSFARVFIASDSLLHLVPLDRNSLSRRWPSAPGLSPEKWFPTNMRQAEGPEGPAKACWSSTFQMSKPRDRRWLSPNGFILWHCRGAAMWQTRQAPLCQGRAELTTGPKCGRETCQILADRLCKAFHALHLNLSSCKMGLLPLYSHSQIFSECVPYVSIHISPVGQQTFMKHHVRVASPCPQGTCWLVEVNNEAFSVWDYTYKMVFFSVPQRKHGCCSLWCCFL